SLTVFSNNAALPVLGVIKIRYGFLQRIQYFYTARFPIFTLEDHDKVIAADVADKVDVVHDDIAQYPAGKLNQFIPTPETVGIVEWLEVIKIAVAGPESNTTIKQAIQVLAVRHIARKHCEGIAIARSLNLHLGYFL